MAEHLETLSSADQDEIPAVRCTGLVKKFESEIAVSNASLNLPRGMILALLGPSGGGKTTMLRMIAGFEIPDSGSIEIEGQVVMGSSRFVPPERRRVGMVFQDYALFPQMNVQENIRFGLRNHESPQRRTDEVLQMVGLTPDARKMPYELSGGQQQRVALARALAPNPAVVLMDEPFSNLDARLRDAVRTDVKRILREAGASAIFVTHDQDEAFGLADRVAIMLGSTIAQSGSPEEVYVRPQTIEIARFLGEVDVVSGHAKDGWVTCELGRLPLAGGSTITGDVQVVIRSESLRLHPEGESSILAEVMDSEFHGIYRLVKVRLPSGITLKAVMGLHVPVTVGEHVPIAVNSTVSAFPE